MEIPNLRQGRQTNRPKGANCHFPLLEKMQVVVAPAVPVATSEFLLVAVDDRQLSYLVSALAPDLSTKRLRLRFSLEAPRVKEDSTRSVQRSLFAAPVELVESDSGLACWVRCPPA